MASELGNTRNMKNLNQELNQISIKDHDRIKQLNVTRSSFGYASSITNQLAQFSVDIPPTNVSIGIKLDRNNFFILREQLMSLIMAYGVLLKKKEEKIIAYGVEDLVNGQRIELLKYLEGINVNLEHMCFELE